MRLPGRIDRRSRSGDMFRQSERLLARLRIRSPSQEREARFGWTAESHKRKTRLRRTNQRRDRRTEDTISRYAQRQREPERPPLPHRATERHHRTPPSVRNTSRTVGREACWSSQRLSPPIGVRHQIRASITNGTRRCCPISDGQTGNSLRGDLLEDGTVPYRKVSPATCLRHSWSCIRHVAATQEQLSRQRRQNPLDSRCTRH